MSDEVIVKKIEKTSFWSRFLAFEFKIHRVLKAVSLIVILMVGMILTGYEPGFGPSMEPTFPIVGSIVKIAPVDDISDLKVGELVQIRWSWAPFGGWIKRIAAIDSKKGVYVLGDNTEESRDSSFGIDPQNPQKQVWIPFEKIRGKIVWMWVFPRSLTAEGRLRDWVYLHFSPQQIIWGPNNYWVYYNGATLSIFNLKGLKVYTDRIKSKNEVFRVAGWHGSNFNYVKITSKYYAQIRWSPVEIERFKRRNQIASMSTQEMNICVKCLEGNSVQNAFDKNLKTGVAMIANFNYCIIDFGKRVSIKKVAVSYFGEEALVYYSNNGTDWTKAGQYGPPPPEVNQFGEIVFETPITAQYWKIQLVFPQITVVTLFEVKFERFKQP